MSMPVLNDWELALDADKVLWGQGQTPRWCAPAGPNW